MAQGYPKSHMGQRGPHGLSHAHCPLLRVCPDGPELERVWFRCLMRLAWVKATHYKPVPRDWHQQLVAAILTRDPEAAEAKMRSMSATAAEDDEAALHYVFDRNGGTEGEKKS